MGQEQSGRQSVSVQMQTEHLQERLGLLASRLWPQASDSAQADAEDESDLTALLDDCVLEARRLESIAGRRIDELDGTTARLLAGLRQRDENAPVRRSPLIWLKRGHSRERSRQQEQWAANSLSALIAESHGLIEVLEDHHLMLVKQLAACEEALGEELASLAKRPISAQPDPETDRLCQRTELLQDFVDALISMDSAALLFINKLKVDTEERIFVLHGLGYPGFLALAESAPRLSALFQRAERGLLSAHGVLQRKTHLDDLFKRRIAQSRQAVSG